MSESPFDPSIETNFEKLEITQIKSTRKEKVILSSLGQQLFNAILSCDFDEQEMLELIDTLTKYHERYNVFTLVKSLCELFDSPKKKSLMLFLRTIVPVKDRFSYEEYSKLFFASEFPEGATSMYSDLVPAELLEKSFKRVEERRVKNSEKERLKEEKKLAEKKEEKTKIVENNDPPITEEQKRLLEEIRILEEGLKKEDDSNYDLKKVIKLLVS